MQSKAGVVQFLFWSHWVMKPKEKTTISHLGGHLRVHPPGALALSG